MELSVEWVDCWWLVQPNLELAVLSRWSCIVSCHRRPLPDVQQLHPHDGPVEEAPLLLVPTMHFALCKQRLVERQRGLDEPAVALQPALSSFLHCRRSKVEVFSVSKVEVFSVTGNVEPSLENLEMKNIFGEKLKKLKLCLSLPVILSPGLWSGIAVVRRNSNGGLAPRCSSISL